jgi:uncharacterized protein
MYKMVEFPSEDAILGGRLYLPQDTSNPLPVVIMAHGFSATIDGMVADRYAEVFYEAGFAVLLYDHVGFGISGGEPRQKVNKWIQARGYRDAIDFVTTLPEIDHHRIAIWGDSASGGEVIVVGAVDQRVKAVVAQVPACGRELPPEDPDGVMFKFIQETLLNGNLSSIPKVTIGPMPVVSFDQVGAPSYLTPLTAFRWFIEYGGRFKTNWENRVTVVIPDTPTPFHPGLCAPYLRASLLMLIAHDDEMPGAETNISTKVFEAAPEPKKLIELDGGHFGLLHYPSPLFDLASNRQRVFLERYL